MKSIDIMRARIKQHSKRVEDWKWAKKIYELNPDRYCIKHGGDFFSLTTYAEYGNNTIISSGFLDE